MIFLADTVIDPYAMMIKFFDANVACFAMLGSRRFDKLTSIALVIPSVIKIVISILFNQFLCFIVIFDDTWIRAAC